MPKEIYLVTESDCDHHAIVGVFDTREAADAERAYCAAMSVKYEQYPMQYEVEPLPLNQSRASLLVRTTADNHVTTVDFFGTFNPVNVGTVEEYDEAWSDGTCRAHITRSVDVLCPPR